MFARTTTLALATAVLATAGAPGAMRTDNARPAASPDRPTRTMSTARTKPGTVRPVVSTTTVVAISAFPTGGKGSGTEATCELWSDQLMADEQALDDATDKQDIIDASESLNENIDNALDAGCAVIYSIAPSPQLPEIKTASIARTARGGYVKTTWAPEPGAVYISAFPTGGKGSGTEATCALWSQRLQDDQAIIDNAPDTDKDDASGPLEQDIEHALDAGCVVIF
jgi:hypothetical protein